MRCVIGEQLHPGEFAGNDTCGVCFGPLFGQPTYDLQLDAFVGKIHASNCVQRLRDTGVAGWRAGKVVEGTKLVDQPIRCTRLLMGTLAAGALINEGREHAGAL